MFLQIQKWSKQSPENQTCSTIKIKEKRNTNKKTITYSDQLKAPAFPRVG